MIKGLYSAASAMMAGINRQALKAHNTANLDTPGFKQVFTTLQEYRQTEVFPPAQDNALPFPQPVGSIGLGVTTTETQTKFAAGALKSTGQPLDFAIQGSGFFRVLTPDGERFTRDGRFIRAVDSSLVTVDGNRVLDASGQPIQLPDGEISVNPRGEMLVNGAPAARLGLAEFSAPETALQKDGGNLFTAVEAPLPAAANSAVRQGALEMSNVSAVDLMVGAKTYEAAQVLIQLQDGLLGNSINTFGKPA